MKKRGQLTLFIFLGIGIVLLLLFYFFFSSDLIAGSVDSAVLPIYEIADSCVSEISGRALLDLGVSGGLYTLPEEINELYIPYYMYEGENRMPSLQTVENEISSYVADQMSLCLRSSFAALPDYTVSYSPVEVLTSINPDDTVSFVVTSAMDIRKGDSVYVLSEPYEVSYDVRLFTMYSVAEQIVREHEREPRALCINCAGDIAYENLVFIDLWDYSPTEVVFYISDGTSYVGGEPFELFFMIKYPEDNSYDPFASV